jgi:threonine dehydratase
VVAFSSGNFGQGLSAACGSLGVKCTIVMPGDAPALKEDRCVSYGASVLRSELIEGENREVSAARLAPYCVVTM